MTDQQPKHVFISYVRENKKQVDRLCQDLERHGVNVWLDRNSIKPGARWKDAIREAIKEGAFFIACFSKEFQSREETHMNEELTIAIERLRTLRYGRVWFIPVLLAECDVPAKSIGSRETLLDINWVPLYEDWEAGIQRIISVIRPVSTEIQNLIQLLKSENSDVREKSAESLGVLGDSNATSALTEALDDKDPRVRCNAAKALGNLGDPSVVPALIVALDDEHNVVKNCAAQALGALGDPIAVPALVSRLKRDNYDFSVSKVPNLFNSQLSYFRYTVANALGRIGPEANDAVPSLREALQDEDEHVCEAAVRALENIGPEAVPALIEALKDDDEKVLRSAATALEKINTPETQKALKEYRKKSK